MINETAEDRATEKDGIIEIAEFMGADGCFFFPPLFAVDALLRREELLRLVEYKRRHADRDKYPTLKIDKAKIDKALEIAAVLGADFLLVIEWNNSIEARIINPIQAKMFPVDPAWKNDRGEIDTAYEIMRNNGKWIIVR